MKLFHYHHNLPKRFIRFQALVGLADIRDGENAIDIGLENAAGEQRHDFSGEEAGGGDLFLHGAGAQDGPANLETFAHHIFSVKLITAAGHGAYENHAAVMGHGFLAGFDVRAADEIKQHIDSFTACPFFCGGCEVVKVIRKNKAVFQAERF